jgi:hypothetical protein
MRSVTPQKPQRGTVSVTSKPSVSKSHSTRSDAKKSPSLHKPTQDERAQDEQRKYPGAALGLALVVGVLLGLLFAAVISSLVSGGSSSSTTGTKPETSPSGAVSSQQAQNQQEQQRSDQVRVDAAPEARDVRILGCGVDGNGYASARVLITNSTDKRATYYVRVLFTAAGDGRTISDDVASVKRLPPGQSAPLQTVNAVDRAEGENVLCRLGSVSRF